MPSHLKVHHSTTQHLTTLHNTTQHYTTLHNTTQHYTALHSTSQHYTAPHSTSQHHTTPHSTSQPLTAPHTITTIQHTPLVSYVPRSSVMTCWYSVGPSFIFSYSGSVGPSLAVSPSCSCCSEESFCFTRKAHTSPRLWGDTPGQNEHRERERREGETV